MSNPVTGNEQPTFAFPWEQTGDSKTEAEAAASLFDNPGPDLKAVTDLADRLEKPDPDEQAAEDEEESAESDAEDESDAEEEESEEETDDSDEDEDAEDAGDDESDEDEDDTDDSEGDRIELPDGTFADNLDELKKGYLRQADYTRKRQREAEEHATGMGEVRAKRDQYDAKLTKVTEILTKLGPKKPDEALRKTNPGEYAAQMQDFREHEAMISGVQEEQNGISEERKAELIAFRNDRIAEARQQLVEAIPEWQKDQAAMRRELGELAEFLQNEWGFSEDQLHNVMDHRLVLMARENLRARQKATKGREKLEAKKGKKAARLKPGSSERTTESRRGRSVDGKAVSQARKRLAQTGHVRDAARLIELELGDSI